MKQALTRIVGVILFTLLTLGSAFALDVPTLTSRITDTAKVLSAVELSQLEQQLKSIEDSTTAQVVVLVIPSLEDQDAFDYGVMVFRKNQLGQAEKNNGVLLLAAMKERKFRIITGRGVEGDIPDIEAGHIIRNLMVPEMKNGHYALGLKAGIERIRKLIAGEEKPTTKESDSEVSPFMVLFLVATVAAIIANAFNEFVGGLVGAAAFAGVSAFAFGTLPSILIAALIGFIIGLLGINLLQFVGTIAGGFSGGGGDTGGGGAGADW